MKPDRQTRRTWRGRRNQSSRQSGSSGKHYQYHWVPRGTLGEVTALGVDRIIVLFTLGDGDEPSWAPGVKQRHLLTHALSFLIFLGRLHKTHSKFCFSSVAQASCWHLCCGMSVSVSFPRAKLRGQGCHKLWRLGISWLPKVSFLEYSWLLFPAQLYLVSKWEIFYPEEMYLLKVRPSENLLIASHDIGLGGIQGGWVLL